MLFDIHFHLNKTNNKFGESMKRLSQTMIATAVAMTMTMATFTASAAPAKSKKHADHALKMRKAVYLVFLNSR